jgi:hypothetical protein
MMAEVEKSGKLDWSTDMRFLKSGRKSLMLLTFHIGGNSKAEMDGFFADARTWERAEQTAGIQAPTLFVFAAT